MTTSREKQETKKKHLALQKKFAQRITIARQARDSFAQQDYVTASMKYNEYLKILADTHNVDDIYALTPALFDPKRDVTEMLLISHVYWEIARINEKTDRLERIFQRAINQFVKFTINQPYQVLNAEMLRKYIKKSKGTSPRNANLNAALQQIFIQSKKCYISTMCFGQSHDVTLKLRSFKDELTNSNLGIRFISFYYRKSSTFVSSLEEHNTLKRIVILLSKPSLRIFAKLTQSSIFKKCLSYLS